MKKFTCSYYIGWLCVSINSSILSYFSIAWVCQWWLRTRHPKCFTKYNYILAAALDRGTQVPLCKCLVLHMDYSRQLQVMVFILSFAAFGASGDSHLFPAWWGANQGSKGLPMKWSWFLHHWWEAFRGHLTGDSLIMGQVQWKCNNSSRVSSSGARTIIH